MTNSANTMTIDLTSTWGEVGIVVEKMYLSKEANALRGMRSEVRKAFAMAQGLKRLMESKDLPGALRELANEVVAQELAKQEHAGGAA